MKQPVQQRELLSVRLAAAPGLKPALLRTGDTWRLELFGSDGVIFILSTQKGDVRGFKDVRSAMQILRDAGFSGAVEVDL